MDEAPKLTLDDLLAWGRDWERYLGNGPRGQGFDVPWAVLQQYVAAANAALAQQQREQNRKKPRSRGGRPPGGMGEQKLRLVESGVREEDADRIVAQEHRRPVESVRRAVKRVSKKPPR